MFYFQNEMILRCSYFNMKCYPRDEHVVFFIIRLSFLTNLAILAEITCFKRHGHEICIQLTDIH